MKASEVFNAIRKEFGVVKIEKYDVYYGNCEDVSHELLVYAEVLLWAFDNLWAETGSIMQKVGRASINILDKDWDVAGPDVIFESFTNFLIRLGAISKNGIDNGHCATEI